MSLLASMEAQAVSLATTILGTNSLSGASAFSAGNARFGNVYTSAKSSALLYVDTYAGSASAACDFITIVYNATSATAIGTIVGWSAPVLVGAGEAMAWRRAPIIHGTAALVSGQQYLIGNWPNPANTSGALQFFQGTSTGTQAFIVDAGSGGGYSTPDPTWGSGGSGGPSLICCYAEQA
jgi:hypothetical protein